MATIIREWLYNCLSEEEMDAVGKFEEGLGPLPETAWLTLQTHFAKLKASRTVFRCNVEQQSGKRKGQPCDRPMRVILLPPGWKNGMMVNIHCGCNYRYHECYSPVYKRIQELELEDSKGKELLKNTAAPPTA